MIKAISYLSPPQVQNLLHSVRFIILNLYPQIIFITFINFTIIIDHILLFLLNCYIANYYLVKNLIKLLYYYYFLR